MTATDSAGNTAVPRSERTAADATETLIAAVDTLAPTAPSFSVCVGDTTVAGNSVFEDAAACGAACADTNSCSRLGGKATLTFTAPSDDGDGSGTGTIAAYTAYAVARGLVTMAMPLIHTPHVRRLMSTPSVRTRCRSPTVRSRRAVQ